MIGLALSGGGSRAMAFHLGCLRALDDLGILEKIGVISTISGGSVIGAYYAYTPHKSFSEFEFDMRSSLQSGFQWEIAAQLMRPRNLLPCMVSYMGSKSAELVSRITPWKPDFKRYSSRTDIFRKVLNNQLFNGLMLNSPRRNNIEVVIGASELRTGSAFRFGSAKSGGWRQGEIAGNAIDVAFAATASAAYPMFLPPLDRTWNFRKNKSESLQRVLLTDGGVYDNLGIQPLEPGRDANFSLHTFPCEHLIVCNAGYGQDSGVAIPAAFLPRVRKSFASVHSRVQDSAMQRLHYMRQAELIKGFALPYLGQQDEALPWRPGVLMPRNEVVGYPTNFAAMPDCWIDKLSSRGEQLTRLQVSIYLPDLI